MMMVMMMMMMIRMMVTMMMIRRGRVVLFKMLQVDDSYVLTILEYDWYTYSSCYIHVGFQAKI